MLRARALQERSNSFVCAFCRQKLSPSDRQLGTRHLSAPQNALGTANSSPRPISPPFRPCGIRSLSTSSALRGPDDGAKPPGPNGGSFPGAGSFGGGLGGFGSFAKSPAIANTETGQQNTLLPHERQARKGMGTAPAPATPSKQEKKQTENGGSRQKASNGDKKQRNNRKNGKQSKNNEPEADQTQRSTSSILAQAFKSKRAPTPVASPTSWARNPEAKVPAMDPVPSPASWGAFSQKKVDTVLPKLEKKSQPPRRESGKGSVGKTNKVTAKKDGANSEAVWTHLKRASRGIDETPAPGEGGDFWDALEDRVAQIKAKGAASAPLPAEARTWSNELGTASVGNGDRPERRESRFAQYDDGGRGKKGKKGQKARSRYEDDDVDWDDDAVNKWESRQRKKAEKEARKQAGEVASDQPTQIFLPEYISVSHLAQAMGINMSDFLHDLGEMGFEDLTEDTIMTGDTAALVVMEYGFDPTVDDGSKRDLRPRPPPEDVSVLPARPPVVTIMGHVDHGKTTLLDWLRKSSVAAQEHGGITQHIGAFVVQMSSGKQITFLDTPGHAAFLSMRQRGANVTDIVVLVVAADDSVMPQTLEALKHATAAKVPIIVAINKIDKEDARVDQVKADLSRHGVEIEDYGGDVQVVCVSGKTGQGMEDLEENIVTLSEILDVRAEQDGMAEGWILESSVKQTGKSASVLVKRGTLRLGDYIVAGKTWARIRGLRNEAGVEVSEVAPGTPVEILGWRELPDAGEMILQAPEESAAKTAVEYRQEMAEREESSAQLAAQEQRQREAAAARELAAMEEEGDGADGPAEPGILYQNFIIKADVDGSVEAVSGTVQEIGNNEAQARVLRASVGLISEADVDYAATSGSVIINFNNQVLPHIRQRANEAKVSIIDHSVIYHIADEVKAAVSQLLPDRITHRVLGEADVSQIFTINIKKRVYRNIAGCRVRNGSIKRSSMVKVIRKGEEVFKGHIDTLKHVKKDVQEMGKGTECGIGLDGFEDLRIDDQIQTFEEVREKRAL